MAKPSKLQRLIDRGFDRSEHIPFTSSWRIRCSQCEALVINGIPAHERGCPNEPRSDESTEC